MRLALALLCLFVITTTSAAAYAAVVIEAAPPLGLTDLSLAVIAGSMLLAWGLRRFTDSGWFHTVKGALLISTASGLAMAIAQAVQAGGLSRTTLLHAVISFMGTLIAQSNPSGTPPAMTQRDRDLLDPPRSQSGGFVDSKVLFACAVTGMIVASLGLFVQSCETSARADVPAFSTGPSAQFFRVGFHPKDAGRLNLGNDSGVDVLSAGLGWSAHYNPPALVRGDVCWLSIDGTAFASLSGMPTSGGMALAAGLSTYNGLVGLAVGYKLFELYDQPNRPMEGLFAGGNGGVRNLFFLVNLSVNVLFGPASKLAPMKTRLGGPPPNYWRLGL